MPPLHRAAAAIRPRPGPVQVVQSRGMTGSSCLVGATGVAASDRWLDVAMRPGLGPAVRDRAELLEPVDDGGDVAAGGLRVDGAQAQHGTVGQLGRQNQRITVFE